MIQLPRRKGAYLSSGITGGQAGEASFNFTWVTFDLVNYLSTHLPVPGAKLLVSHVRGTRYELFEVTLSSRRPLTGSSSYLFA